MKKIGLFLLFVFVFPALAIPVYLDCYVVTHNKNKVIFTVMANETTGSITHVSNVQEFKTMGYFSPTKIKYKQEMTIAGMIMLNEFEIDRNDLNIVQNLVMTASNPEFASQVPPTSTVQKGSCTIADVSKQKI